MSRFDGPTRHPNGSPNWRDPAVWLFLLLMAIPVWSAFTR